MTVILLSIVNEHMPSTTHPLFMWVTLPVNDNVAEFSFEFTKNAQRIIKKIISVNASKILRFFFIKRTIAKKRPIDLFFIVLMFGVAL